MSTQGSTKFKPGDRIVCVDKDGDATFATVAPWCPISAEARAFGEEDYGPATVWAHFDRYGKVLFTHEDQCTLIPDPPDLDRLRAVNAKLVAALEKAVSWMSNLKELANVVGGQLSDDIDQADAALAEAAAPAPPSDGATSSLDIQDYVEFVADLESHLDVSYGDTLYDTVLRYVTFDRIAELKDAAAERDRLRALNAKLVELLRAVDATRPCVLEWDKRFRAALAEAKEVSGGNV